MARRCSLKNLYNRLERKTVIITNSSSHDYWYARMIGKKFIVFETKSDKKENLWTLDDGEYDTFISKNDCSLVDIKRVI